ncbi:MAG: hypothetical protein JWN88_429 [Frankiales bacterium]|jgi:hypothetical protein|nr:hypothetical protein [Frankiales bacterium]
MTTPDQSKADGDELEGTGETGALEAASTPDPDAGDPLGPLNTLTESGDDSG